MSPKPYDLTEYDGRRVDWLTRAALEVTAERLGYDLTITQGSYNAGGVAASAGTHDGGGVVDLAAWDQESKVRELRRTGFAAWFRPAISGLWPAHIHAVLIGNERLSSGARAQVADYLAGRDGLAGDGPDTGPRKFIHHRFDWHRHQEETVTPQDLEKIRAMIPTAEEIAAAVLAATVDHKNDTSVKQALRQDSRQGKTTRRKSD